ncbi:MAG: CPBP family intramembrane metalloprotease [Bacteroidales bacterium]|nr:CPBP family intramembrane metalloprotease [Bacteroidales bacterium]
MNNSLSYLHPGGKFLVAIMVCIFSSVVFSLIGFLLSPLLFDITINEAFAAINGELDIQISGFLKLNQAFQSFGLFVFPAIVLGYMYTTDGENYIGYKTKVPNYIYLLVIASVITMIPFINYTGAVNQQIDLPDFMSGIENSMKRLQESSMDMQSKLLFTESYVGLIVNILLIGVLPALGEELLFRGIMQRTLSEFFKNHHIGILVTSVGFAAMHLQFYTFIPLFIFGVYFGYLFYWTKTIWVPILAHFVNNTTAVILHYMHEQGKISANPEEIGTSLSEGFMYILPGLLLSLIFVYMVYNKSQNR